MITLRDTENVIQGTRAKARIQAMKDTSRILDLKYKLQTIELLNLAKEQYTYRELSGILHLPETVLSRYVKGHVLPTAERAEEINRTLQKYMSLEKELYNKLSESLRANE